MAYVPVRIVGPQFLVPLATAGPIKTFTTKTIIKNIMFSNIFSGDLLYNVYLAKAGEIAQDFNKIIPQGKAPAASLSLIDLTLVVNPGDKLYATGSVPNGLLITISGVEVI
jgi:hypothetical protein